MTVIQRWLKGGKSRVELVIDKYLSRHRFEDKVDKMGTCLNIEMAQKKLYTLVFAKKDTQVLLGLKKRGFGRGLWNGFGGKIENGETLIQAAIREMKEECGITVMQKNLKHIGHLEFYFHDNPVAMHVKVFSTLKFEGQVTESEEMKPKWFDVKCIPFSDMWPDDRYWFSYVLDDRYFIGKYWYHGLANIVRHDLREVKPEELESLLVT